MCTECWWESLGQEQGAGGFVAQSAEGFLPGMDEVPCPMCIDTCDLSSSEVEAGGSEVQDEPWLKCKFQAFLSYMRPCLQNRNKSRGRWSREVILLETKAP